MDHDRRGDSYQPPRRRPGALAQLPPVQARPQTAPALRSQPRLPRSRALAHPKALEALLLARGVITTADLATARAARIGLDRPMDDILLARGALSEVDLVAAQAECHGLALSDLAIRPPAKGLAQDLPAAAALVLEAVPTRRIGNLLVVATCRPDQARAIQPCLPDGLRALVTLAPRSQIIAAQIALYGEEWARLAEGQAPLRDSCRGWRAGMARRGVLAAVVVLIALAALLPVVATGIVFGFALLVFAGNITLKATAFASALRDARPRKTVPRDAPPLPIVSLIVPLFQEHDIAHALVARLSRLDYPRERLDVLLAVEQDDPTTRKALAAAKLPAWFRVITVPTGHPRTKPRALNFALNFARGEIIGIYDAEDRPDPDQILRIARRFADSPPDVACLQGQLDYYNARHNVLARLFAIEYATWFRVLLPGVERLGLVVPLGGTTLFLRRSALDAVGGWDAHNVTEDAELGLRLARRGYRTELIETTTFEEANAAVVPWIRQRARWQKGYLMTWAIAMRAPRSLWRDLGTLRFLAIQVQFLCAVAGFLVAPLLWSLMIKPFGLAHPLDALMPPLGYGILGTAFVASVVLSMGIAVFATRPAHLRQHRPYVLLSELYFLLATVSAWRAALDMFVRPFWWAKTAHGGFGGTRDAAAADAFTPAQPEPPALPP